MNKTEIFTYRKVNKLFKFILNSLNHGYNENIVFSIDDVNLCKDSTYIFEVLNSFMAIHVAKGHEEDVSRFLDDDWLEELVKNFNITIKPGTGRKDTIYEKVKQIRNCILHRNVFYRSLGNRVFFENKYSKGETSFENYLLSLYELFTVNQPYTSGKGVCFKSILPEIDNMEVEQCIDVFLKQAKFVKYKNPYDSEKVVLLMKKSEIGSYIMKESGDGVTLEVGRENIKKLKRTELDDVIKDILKLLNVQIYSDTAMNIEGKIKKYIKLAKERYPTKCPRDRFKRICNEVLPSIKVYDLKKDLGKEFLKRISFMGKDKFSSLTIDEKCALVNSVFIDKILSKERNDNDHYSYIYLAVITDYLSKQKTSGNASIETMINQVTELQKKFEIDANTISHLKLESPIMFENVALAHLYYSIATFKELFDKDLKKDKEQKGQDDVLIDLDDINIPEGIKYKCYVERKSFENELEKKIKGQNNELDVQKNVISKGFYFNTKYRRALNPKNPKINDVKNTLFDNKERIQEAFERLKLISKRTGKLKVKKDLLNKSKGKFIEVTNDNKEFFRSMRDALSHNWITIDRTNAYKTGDLNDLSFTFKDYEMKEKKINGKMQKVRGKQIFEATMTMRDFFELTSNIERALEQNHDKDKVSLVDIAKDALVSDLNISLADICEELIPTERSK